MIVETEAYHESEPACHAFVGLTPRTATLFGPPGRAYVYRSYGIHALLNAVCEPEGVGAAVLIRALAPLAGIEQMRAASPGRERAGVRGCASEDLCSGPGKLTQALGIALRENGDRAVERAGARSVARGREWREPSRRAGHAIGITRAVELPWRFCVAGSRARLAPAAVERGRPARREEPARREVASSRRD